MQEQQLAFGLPETGSHGCRRPRRLAGQARARWWFHKMHRAVDAAVEWNPAPGRDRMLAKAKAA